MTPPTPTTPTTPLNWIKDSPLDERRVLYRNWATNTFRRWSERESSWQKCRDYNNKRGLGWHVYGTSIAFLNHYLVVEVFPNHPEYDPRGREDIETILRYMQAIRHLYERGEFHP